MKTLRNLLICLTFLVCLIPMTATAVSADEQVTATEPVASQPAAVKQMAEEISNYSLVKNSENIPAPYALFDGNTRYKQDSNGPSSFTLESDKAMGSLYISFGKENMGFTLTDLAKNKSVKVEPQLYMHQFVDIVELMGAPVNKLKVSFDKPSSISEVNVFTEGEVPDWVQKWETPVEDGADLVLFAAHDDDPQLFFAGILPYYANNPDYKVQVVFLTNHKGEPYRFHEMLNGLWAIGVRNYPIAGDFADFNVERDLQGTYNAYVNLGVKRDDLVSFVVENIRRFQPKVAIGHDINGEYGHGMHLLCADLLKQAVEVSNDPEKFPESANKYGTWDIPKVYLHLYDQNQIVLDWDQPLDTFDGKTPYEVSRDIGFPFHESQYNDFFWFYRNNPTAASVKYYSPCQYGLFRTLVGDDVAKNDFFENLTTYAADMELAIQAEEEAAAAAQAEKEADPDYVPKATPVPAPVVEQRDPSEYAPVENTIPTWAYLYLIVAVVIVLVILVVQFIRRRFY